MIYFLWTDGCFLFVLAMSAVGVMFGLRKPPIRLGIRDILSQPMAVSAGLVFMVFLTIGILDCIHLQPSAFGRAATHEEQPDTVLDYVLSPIGQVQEKTYSAPLALTLFSKEIVVRANKVKEIYPRLSYPPKAIQTSEQKRARIQHIVLKAFFWSVLFMMMYASFLKAYAWHFKRKRPILLHALPFITVGLMLFLMCSAYWMSRDFHVLGTGKIGQDILYLSVKSIRTGLVIGLLTTLIMLPLALFLGIAAGYFGGWVDDAVQYVYTTLSSIPGVLLISASVLSLQTYIANHPEQFPSVAKSADARLFALCVILGITSWTSLCRLLRAETFKLRQLDYVLAARALGSSSWCIIRKHLLPNVMPMVLITLVLDFSFLVLAEAVLAYVGVGVSPLTISFGNMINGARLELAREPLVWWPIASAFVLMFALVLVGNVFADAVRDAFDPHQRKS